MSPGWRTRDINYNLLSCVTASVSSFRSLCQYANHLGFSLDAKKLAAGGVPGSLASQRGFLTDVPIPLRSEFDVYSFLGLRYIPPARRGLVASAKNVGVAAPHGVRSLPSGSGGAGSAAAAASAAAGDSGSDTE